MKKLKLFISDLTLKQALLTNYIIGLIWWLIFLPGFYTDDSFAVLNMAKSGNITSEWTAIWGIFVRIATLGGARPELATLIIQICCLS